MSTEDADPEELRDRVNQLEATVEKMLPSRRDALKLGAAGAIGAVGMRSASDPSSATGHVGQIGTDTDRVDLYANSVDTDDATFNGSVTYPDGTTVTTSPGGIWTEDANSPQTVSANSVSVTLNSAWEFVSIFITAEDTATSSAVVDMTVNGDTGSNYDYVARSGTETTSASAWENLWDSVGTGAGRFQLLISQTREGLGITNLGGGSGTSYLAIGENRAVASTLNSFTLSRGAGTAWTVEVYGRNQ
jgi:hypothetical protein